MKNIKLIIPLLLFCLSVGSANAQRNLPGQMGIHMSAGMVDGFLFRYSDMDKRFFCSMGWSITNNNQSRWVAGITYQHKDYVYGSQLIPKAQYSIDGGYYIPIIFDKGRNISLSAGLSGVIGYETVNRGVRLLDDGATLKNKSCFLYGASLGLELDVYIID